MTLDSLTDSDLVALGLADPGRARRLLTSLAGGGVTDDIVAQLLPSLLDALRESPDPDRALNNFVRWIESVTSRYTQIQYLLRHPTALRIFFNVCGVSQFFSDILVRNPEYFEILANPGVRGPAGGSPRTYYRELSGFVDGIVRTELKLEAMRRFKQREVLRIGARDILGLADMPATAREFSHLADALVQKCCEIGAAHLAGPVEERQNSAPPGRGPLPFAVIGMGKLGGQELNYSSDIDLMFVCGDDPSDEAATDGPTSIDYARKLAEFVVNALSRNLQNGHLFRVDMRLRPEGRFGPLVRTLSSYRAYYESWAEPWERQSLLKARWIAGDMRLGDAFSEMVRRYVYRRSVTSDFVEAIRQNKERIEKKAEMEGVARTNVKVGYGGIRDIEFAVQLLQLERGGRDPRLRTPNTLDAIARLRHAGILEARTAAEMSEDYQFLRTVEHRLQILYERQTQSLPADPHERRLLARRLGYADAEAFDADYARRTERVRQHFEQVFYGAGQDRPDAGPDHWKDLLANVETAPARAAVIEALRDSGFHEPDRAYTLLKAAVAGSDYGAPDPEARALFLGVAGRLVTASGRTGDPDTALRSVETLAQAGPNPAMLYRALAESDELLDRLCCLAAGSPPLAQSLAHHLQWLDLLVSDEIVDPALKTAEQARAELEERLAGAKTQDGRWDAMALYIQRERLRIGARDLWGEISALGVVQELTALAEATIQMLLADARESVAAGPADAAARAALDSVAVIGMGKLGGREIGYGSDWDIAIVYAGEEGKDDSPAARRAAHAAVNGVAEILLAAGQNLRPRGAPVEIDARLRPEGQKGALAYTVAAYRDYYLRSALTWERQVLTRARPVAGSSETARAYMRAVHEAIYRTPLSAEAHADILAMKRRIESERLKANERHTDVKLGHGGLTDIEFTVQMLQMRIGATTPPVRMPGTVEALRALASAGAIPAPEAARLADTHTLWTAIRNHLALLGGVATDALPADPRRLRALARGLGIADTPAEPAEAQFRRLFDERMRETRAIVERLFYASRP